MNLSISALKEAYQSKTLTPKTLVDHILETNETANNPAIWIVPPNKEQLHKRAEELNDPSLPLYGIPFVAKDNIDIAGLPTTAGCPEYAYTPTKNASVVQHLLDAGALLIGKSNLDQFATGLVGTRSPYGVARNPFHADYIPGGSSSGSAVALAEGLCSFSLGTDTAGSGRVPASFNNLIGLKPSKGLLSTSGVVPACRSLDCVSVFALDANDANTVLDIAAQFDSSDPFSRKRLKKSPDSSRLRLGVPRQSDLTFLGDKETEKLFCESVNRFKELGATLVEIDFEPFLQAARLLYEGPWVSERYVAIESFLKAQPDDVYPVTRAIIEGGANPSAADLFKAEYRLQELKRITETVWEHVDAIITPTAGTHYTVEQIEQTPVELNSNLGTYTNFMNLLDFAAVAVPAGFVDSGMPWGITLFAPAFSDAYLLEIASRFHQATQLTTAQTTYKPVAFEEDSNDLVSLVVCGAHLEGLALNHQLVERGASLTKFCKTASTYRIYAMPAEGNIPPRPAMIYDQDSGAAVDVEVWSLSKEAFGDFVAQIPAPLGIGKIALEDGSIVPGFIAEPRAQEGAEDITHHGGWRNWLKSKSATS